MAMPSRGGAVFFLAACLALSFPIPSYADWDQNMKQGEFFYKTGDKTDAEKLFKAALQDASAFKANDPRLAATLNDLAILCDEAGRYDEAEKDYKQALAIREQAFGPDSEEVATTSNNLANLYKDQKKYPEAEEIYTRVLKIYTKVSGPESSFVALAHHNLAVLYQVQGKDKEAIAHFEQSIAAGEKSLGANNPHVVDCVGSLAMLYVASGQTDKAKPLLKRYLESTEKFLHLDPADPKSEIAVRDFARVSGGGVSEILEQALKYKHQM